VSEAHRRGIRVLLDLVINHTSDRHPWFVESRSSRTSPKRDWYLWHAGPPPNNWFAGFELRSAWWLDERTGERYLLAGDGIVLAR
jgi:alpha-glucosidase